MPFNQAASAAYTRALALTGLVVTINRMSGLAPNRTTVASASVNARILQLTADSTQTAQAGIGASAPGSIEQADRKVIVMMADLIAKGFPVPVKQGDSVVLPNSGEELNVLFADPNVRGYAGAYVLDVVGVT